MNVKSTSPLKDKPLRQAGQSVQERIDELIDDGVMSYWFFSLFFAVLALYEWVGWYWELPRQPLILSFFAIGLIGYSIFKTRSLVERIRKLKQGRDGERAVGQFLELFREDGCRVFHDILGDGFNVDHVLVSEKGIFTIETKTYSKPKDGKIKFDGKRILGFASDEKLLTQAKAQSSWLKNVVAESTGRKFDVYPIIVFPGWFVESTAGGLKSEVTILNPRQLRGYISSLSNALVKEDQSLIAYHLSRYIRN